MKRTFVLSIVFQIAASGFHANAQVTETHTETSTTTRWDGKRMSTQTETSTYAGGVYTHTGTDTSSELFFGARLDVTASGFLLKGLPDRESTMKGGGSLRGFMRVEFQKGFVMQPEVIVHYKASMIRHKSTGAELDYEHWGMEIPVYYMGRIKIGRGKGFIGAGPYVGFGIGAQYTAPDGSRTDLYKKDRITGDRQMQRWDFGFGSQLTYEFSFGLQINAGYKIGVIDALDAGSEDSSMLPQMVSWGVGFRF